MAWKGWVYLGLATYLTLQWKVAQFLDKANILLQKCFGSPRYFHLIWREACLSQCITPSEPVMRVPITFLYSCIALEPQDSWRLAAICFCDSLNLVKDVLLIDCHRYYPLILKHDTKSVVGP